MTAFDDGIDAMFEDPNIAVDATWRTGGAGNGVPVRVIISRPQEEVGFRDTRFELPALLIDVRLSEIAEPAKGDTVEFEDESVVEITDLGRRDSSSYVQTCSAAPLDP